MAWTIFLQVNENGQAICIEGEWLHGDGPPRFIYQVPPHFRAAEVDGILSALEHRFRPDDSVLYIDGLPRLHLFTTGLPREERARRFIEHDLNVAAIPRARQTIVDLILRRQSSHHVLAPCPIVATF
jgi:hypothetical protein